MPSPRQTFEDNILPAILLLRVYRLLENDQIHFDGDFVDAFKKIVGASSDEDVMVLWNELFQGIIRERAQIPRSTFRMSALAHLLRQSIVISSTALETFLPALLETNLPIVIQAVGRDFVPRGDDEIAKYFEGFSLSLRKVFRLLEVQNQAEFISDSIMSFTSYKYLSSTNGIHVVGRLLGIPDPMTLISERINRDKDDLESSLKQTFRRRNDIVHRADRKQRDPQGEMQEITYAWAKQAVDTVHNVCLALDELVQERMIDFQGAIETLVSE